MLTCFLALWTLFFFLIAYLFSHGINLSHTYIGMKNFSFNQTQWLGSLLSASCVSVVSRLWKLTTVLLQREHREGGGGVRESTVHASIHQPRGKHQPLNQQSNNACKHKSWEQAPPLCIRIGPPSKKIYINKSILKRENEKCYLCF